MFRSSYDDLYEIALRTSSTATIVDVVSGVCLPLPLVLLRRPNKRGKRHGERVGEMQRAVGESVKVSQRHVGACMFVSIISFLFLVLSLGCDGNVDGVGGMHLSLDVFGYGIDDLLRDGLELVLEVLLLYLMQGSVREERRSYGKN